MNDRYGFNPRKCNSASTLRGCIQREMSRVIIALPTSNEILDIFEQTITGGFSCVNNRLAFDSEIFLPNAIKQNTESKNYRKGYDLKVCYNIKLNSDKIQPKRVITKILKLDENNHYGFDMTKPLPTGCIKANSDISFKKLNDLIRTLDIDSAIATVAKRNEKKKKYEKTVTAKHWNTECNQKTKTINFCRIVNFLCKAFFLEIKHIFENNMS